MITFREFLIICEKKSSIPPHAVPGTYKEVDGVKTYTLAPYEGPSGPLKTEKKVKKVLDKQGGIGGGAIKKAKKKAKTIEKIKEDLQHRRAQLAKRQRENVSAFKKRVAAKSSSFKEKIAKRKEREDLKREIKRELQTEQTPHMNPTPFNIMKAREQAKGGIQHRKHVHQEIGAEARAQQAAKASRMKEILSR